MSQKIVVVAKVYPKKEEYKEVKNQIIGNIEKAKKEIGNIYYELFVDHDNEHELAVIEKWETYEDYLRHKKSEFLRQFEEFVEGKLDKPTKVEVFNHIKS